MALVVEGLRVTFGRRVGLRSLDLEVPDRSITAFLGHNGAGKTTAMRAVLGLIPARCRRLEIDGLDVRRDRALLRARAGALIETTAFQPGWSARTNLIALARLQGLGRVEARTEADQRLEQVGLTEHAHRDPTRYSQGMRQRLGLAQALLGGRRTLLLDEPSNGLDPEGIADLWALLRRLRDEDGCSILLSSHLLGEVEGLCDAVVVLREGERVAAGTMEHLRAATGNRHQLVTTEPARAEQALAELELEATRAQTNAGASFDFALDERDPADVLQRLVDAGVRPMSFARAGGGLTEVYRAARDGRLASASETLGTVDSSTSAEDRRPRRSSILRLLGFEARRHSRIAWLIALQAAAALLPIRKLVAAREEQERAVEAGELFSATEVTAFRAAAESLELGLPLACLVAMGLASQLLAGELGRGTLRNVALRPLSRLQLGLGKVAAALLLGLLCVGSSIGVALSAGAANFTFGDLEEIISTGQRFPIMTAAEVSPEFRSALAGALAIGVCIASLGLLAGALTRRGTTALSLAYGLFLSASIAGLVTRDGDWTWANPATYLPSVASDGSHIHAVAVLAGGATNKPFEYADTAFTLPLGVALAASLVTLVVVARRRIP